MKELLQELEVLKKELEDNSLMLKRAKEGREREKEKAIEVTKNIEVLKRQMSTDIILDPVEALLAGRDPDYSAFGKLKDSIEREKELLIVHEKIQRDLFSKIQDLMTKIDFIKPQISECRRKIIKKAGLKLINETDRQLICNLLLAIGIWSGDSLIRCLVNVPGFLSSESWGLTHEAAVKDLLEKSGAQTAL